MPGPNHEDASGRFSRDFPRSIAHRGGLDAPIHALSDLLFPYVYLVPPSYESCRQLTSALYPRIPLGGVMLLGNYGDPYHSGPRKAWMGHFEALDLPYAILDSGTAVVIKQ